MLNWCWKIPRSLKRGRSAIALLSLVVPLAGANAADGELDPALNSVSLDELLTLPSALPGETVERGGLSRGEWTAKFAAAEAEVDAAKADLEASLDKLTAMMEKTSNWKVAAPGAQPVQDDGSPTNYGLKQEIRRKREEVTRAERKLIDLRVEANLAGVPEDWYRDLKPPE